MNEGNEVHLWEAACTLIRFPDTMVALTPPLTTYKVLEVIATFSDAQHQLAWKAYCPYPHNNW